MPDECPVCGGPKKHSAVKGKETINECRRGHKWVARPEGATYPHKYKGPDLKDPDSEEGGDGADTSMGHTPPT